MCDRDLQPDLLKNIVMAGATVMFPGTSPIYGNNNHIEQIEKLYFDNTLIEQINKSRV